MKVTITLESLADVQNLEQTLPSLKAMFTGFAKPAKGLTLLQEEVPWKLPKFAKGMPVDDYLALPISELRVSRRALNSLKYGDLETIQDVVNKTAAELLTLPNFGSNCLNQVKARLQESGLQLKTF